MNVERDYCILGITVSLFMLPHLINLLLLTAECPQPFGECCTDDLSGLWLGSSLPRLLLLATKEWNKCVMCNPQSAINWSQLLSLFLCPRGPSGLIWPQI